jgi:hypothetical protein
VFGQLGVTATDLSFDTGSSEKNGDARGGEGGFNDQLFLTNTNAILSIGSLDQQSTRDKVWLNSDFSLASDSHPIQTKPNTALTRGESSGTGTSIVDENISFQADVHPDGSMISDGIVNVPNFNIGFDFSTPGGEGPLPTLRSSIVRNSRLSPSNSCRDLSVKGTGL